MVEQLDKLMNALYEKSTISHNKKHSEIIKKKLDFKVVVINLWRKTHTLACGMKATFHLIYT